MKYYVYALRDPRTHEVKYIGKGTGKRMYEHVKKAKKNKADSKNFTKLAGIKSILKAGFDDVEYEILFETDDEKLAYRKETEFIEIYHTLIPHGWNIVKDQVPTSIKSRWQKGHRPWNKGLVGSYSEEYRNRISEGTKKAITTETIEKWRLANIDKVPWNKGLTNIYSDETKQKMREAKVNKTLSEQHKIKISEGLKNSERYKKVAEND